MKTVVKKSVQKLVRLSCPDCGTALERDVSWDCDEAVFQCLECFGDPFKWVEGSK